ncbi:MAG: Asp-tRNA(Asn)/Glu-tRNA(Gln) amidotransferase subunit GatB [Pirellulaceae bacterium]|nr:Asp-tRNA(Asn)/Glu-tRNA(Gln) amidotransferase subunit GatB [Pirellulaceae bacterium]
MTDSTEQKNGSLPYEMIIGLEVHVQLKTETKLFCRCSTKFGAEPNTQTCPVCIGMPGALPVMNRRAYDLAIKTALALDIGIPHFTKWDRKNYYYPDLPRGYQISQFDLPLSEGGKLEISDPKGGFKTKNVGITRAHLEDDAGKSLHDEASGKADTRIDLNRTGTPLLEIVSEPDMSSPQEAKGYLTELKLLLTYLEVSDCNMQEGSLRVDANVNLKIQNGNETVYTPIVEVKNMNSFRAVERAVAYEAKRQYTVWQETGLVKGQLPKQTRGWDDSAQITRAQREKEDASDYRYFPEPDLCPAVITEEEIASYRATLPELPGAIRKRLQGDFDLNPYDADVIVNQGQGGVDYYEELAKECGDGKQASNWFQQDVLRKLNESETTFAEFSLQPSRLAGLLLAVQKKEVDTTRAKDVFGVMYEKNLTAQEGMKELGIEQVDTSALSDLCKMLLEKNPQVVEDVKSGKKQAVGALIGQAKKANPNVNPGEVRKVCLDLIEQG